MSITSLDCLPHYISAFDHFQTILRELQKLDKTLQIINQFFKNVQMANRHQIDELQLPTTNDQHALQRQKLNHLGPEKYSKETLCDFLGSQ